MRGLVLVVALSALATVGCGGRPDEPKVGNVKEDPRLQQAVAGEYKASEMVARPRTEPKKLTGKALE